MKDGYLNLDQGSFRVGPGTRGEAFVASGIGAQSALILSNQQYRTYKTPIQIIDDRSFLLTLSFEDGHLASVRLYPVEASPAQAESWASYSEADQLKKKMENDRWLLSVFGTTPPYTLPWGSVQSVFDARSGASEIIIRYVAGDAVSRGRWPA